MYDWRLEWEKAAKAEAKGYARQPVDALLEKVARGFYGQYYALWREIAARVELEEAGWLLMKVLRSNADYHNRYHCAAALLTLMGKSPVEAVQYSGDITDLQSNLNTLENELQALIGPPELNNSDPIE